MCCCCSIRCVPLAPAWRRYRRRAPPVVPGAKPAMVERIKIHGTALEGNLEGDAVDRDALVFLPPSYKKEKRRRYPVVYALHGYSIGAEQWSKEIHVPQTIEGAFAQGAKEMIVVLPDSKTMHNGSMYSSSVTTGDFENFIARDVVAYMDAHYRTIPERRSRGLVGHSMGGYGATRIGMKHADVFGSLYIMSPCCLSPRRAGPANPEVGEALAAVKTPADSAQAAVPCPRAAGGRRGLVAQPEEPAAVPGPADEGRRGSAGRAREVGGQRTAGLRRPVRRQAAPLSRQSLSMWAIRTACEPTPASCTTFWTPTASRTASRSIHGTHTSAVAVRFQNHVMPFFSSNLCFAAGVADLHAISAARVERDGFEAAAVTQS